MRKIAEGPSSVVTVDRPSAREGAATFGTEETAWSPTVPRHLVPRRPPLRTRIGGFLWTAAGALTILLTVSWVLWYGPHPLMGPDGVILPLTDWLSPPTYAGVLAAWGCFSRASEARDQALPTARP